MGPKTETFYTQVKSAPYETCHWSKAHCTCFWPDKAPVNPSLSTLLDFQLFLSFCSESEMLHSSTLCPLYECQRTGRPPPPSTSHTTPNKYRTSKTRIPPPRYIDTTYSGLLIHTNLHHGHRRQCGSCIRKRGRLDLSYDARASLGRREASRYKCF